MSAGAVQWAPTAAAAAVSGHQYQWPTLCAPVSVASSLAIFHQILWKSIKWFFGGILLADKQYVHIENKNNYNCCYYYRHQFRLCLTAHYPVTGLGLGLGLGLRRVPKEIFRRPYVARVVSLNCSSWVRLCVISFSVCWRKVLVHLI